MDQTKQSDPQNDPKIQNIQINQPIKILLVIFGILFVYASYVQYNDPDPLFWGTLYMTAATLSFTSTIIQTPNNIFSQSMTFGVFCIASGLLIHTALEWTGGIKGMYNFEREIGREQGGLTIIIIWCMFHMYVIRNRDVKMLAQVLTCIIVIGFIAMSIYIVPKYLVVWTDRTSCQS
eukprot:TRINITY_DN40096_c0_g1_i5.p2 TRINITY_DN40096_c0_g1~~TRINITY_DN40096_c0_g1_i5.p2  ORF type:complete len:201 (-),score=-7.59 TRINITY_DN40096_c0_g1_i5:270-800(-)